MDYHGLFLQDWQEQQRGIHLGSDLFHPAILRDTSHGGRGSRSAPQARGESEVDDKLLSLD